MFKKKEIFSAGMTFKIMSHKVNHSNSCLFKNKLPLECCATQARRPSGCGLSFVRTLHHRSTISLNRRESKVLKVSFSPAYWMKGCRKKSLFVEQCKSRTKFGIEQKGSSRQALISWLPFEIENLIPTNCFV
ncbi:UNVERIFIED_CONTAM: hypothetical protein NCL1_51647 [Trichonephila clavipes]